MSEITETVLGCVGVQIGANRTTPQGCVARVGVVGDCTRGCACARIRTRAKMSLNPNTGNTPPPED